MYNETTQKPNDIQFEFANPKTKKSMEMIKITNQKPVVVVVDFFLVLPIRDNHESCVDEIEFPRLTTMSICSDAFFYF